MCYILAAIFGCYISMIHLHLPFSYSAQEVAECAGHHRIQSGHS